MPFSSRKLTLRLVICAAVLAALAQPAFATTYQYRVSALGVRATDGTPPPATPVTVKSWSVTGATATNFTGATALGLYANPDLQVLMTNTGNAVDSLVSPAMAGINADDFRALSACHNIAVNATCAVTVRFLPTAGGARTASLALGSSTPLTFTGLGLVRGWAVTGATTTAFAGTTVVGQFATPNLTVVMTNTGNAVDSLTLPAWTGSPASDFSATGACTDIAANATCAVTVRFKPTTVGARTATLALGDSAPLTYSGTATAPASTDPFAANVGMLLHMDGVAGGTSVTDMAGHVVSTFGTPSLVANPVAFGTTSLAVTTAGSYLFVPSNSETAFGSKDFTVEGWFYFSSAGTGMRPLYLNYTTWGSGSLFIGGHSVYGGNISFMSNGVFDIHEPGAAPLSQWVHYAFVRKGTTVAIYRNGVATVTGTVGAAAVVTPASNANYIGGAGDGSRNSALGYIDEFRITNGVARYTGNFTPPTAAFPDP